MAVELVVTPDSPSLGDLTRKLRELSEQLQSSEDWPAEQLATCARFGVFRWFVAQEQGGLGWSHLDVVRGYLNLAAACLTTTFIITQRTGACRRIAASKNVALRDRLLPDLLNGRTFSTVGISHLTTSRQHLDKPVLLAEEAEEGFVLRGLSPWVTGARSADHLVIGAALEDGRQLLAAVPSNSAGISIGEPARLVALSASQTGPVHFDGTFVPLDFVLDGPRPNVMQRGQGANTGGLETSTLAVGLATAALGYIQEQKSRREELSQPSEHLEAELCALRDDLLAAAEGDPDCNPLEIRGRANSLVLRMTQAALTSAKGAGYVDGHPVGRWCREALFFLVWSCPTSVLSANLCELARIE